MSEHFIPIEEARGDLLSCAAFLAETITSHDGHAAAMSAVVPRYLAKGNVDLAAELANTVDDPFTRDKLLMLVAEKCAALDDDEYAVQLAEAVEEPALQLQARERVAIKKVESGNFAAAEMMANNIPHADALFSAMAIKHAAAGDMKAAGDALNRVEFPGAKVQAMLTITAEDPETSVDMLESAAAAANDIEHKEEKIRTLIDIGDVMAESGHNDRAIEIFGKACGVTETLGNVQIDSFFASIAVGFMRAGSTELADRTLDLVDDKTQIASGLLGFGRELWKRGEKEDAVESLDEAYAILRSQKDSETRDTRAKYALFSAISAQYAGFEKGERAIETSLENEDAEGAMSALGQTAQIMTIQGSHELSAKAIDAIHEDANRVFAIIGVSDAHERNGDNEAALAELNTAFDLSENVPQLASKTSAYVEASARFHKHGLDEKARAAADLALRTISRIRDESNRTAALAALADVYDRSEFTLNGAEKEVLTAMVNATLV